MAAAWRRFRDDPDDWVAIITGVAGNFMAGADLKTFIPQVTALQKEIAAGEVDEIDGCRLRDGSDAVLRTLDIYKPIIAAVDGPCVAGGMEMLGGADIRLATERATFGVMEPKRGLFAGGGTTVRLPRQIAFPAAMEFLLTAEAFPASRALELGLVNEIVPEAELVERALWWARRITVNAPMAVRATKESVLRGLAVDQREAYEIESTLTAKVFSSDDAKEGPRAFAEKRDAELDRDLAQQEAVAGGGAAVDRPLRAGDVRRLVGGKEAGDSSHLLDRAHARDGQALGEGAGIAVAGRVAHERVDPTRVQRVDADAERSEVHGGRLGESPHGPLARHVGAEHRQAPDPAVGRHVDDRPATCPLHGRRHRLHAQHGADQVDVEHAAEALDVLLLDRRGIEHAGVVDEHG